MRLAGPLDFDVFAVAGHDQVHVDFGVAVLRVTEVEEQFTRHDAGAHRGHRVAQRFSADQPAFAQPPRRQGEGDVAAGDRRRAGPAIGLDDVTVDPDRARAERVEIDDRAQAAPDQTLDLVRPSADAPAYRLARDAGPAGARQHGILGGDPTASGIAQKLRHRLLDRGGADDAGFSDLDQHRAVDLSDEPGGDGDRTQLVRTAAIDTRHGRVLTC